MDVTGQTEAETRLRQHITAHTDILDRMTTAVAVFGPDRKRIMRLRYWRAARAIRSSITTLVWLAG